MWQLLLHSLLLAAAVCALAVPVGVLLAGLLVRGDLPARRAILAVLVAPVLVPLVVQAAAWQSGFGMLGWYTLAQGGGPWLEGWRGAIVVHAATAVGWVVLIVAAALRLGEPELEEQALLDASPLATLARVTLRRAIPAAVVAALWVAVATTAEMTVTDFFQVRTFAEVVYTELHVEPGQVPLRAGTGTLIVGGLVLLGMLLAYWLMAPAWSPPERTPLPFALGSARWLALGGVALVALLVAGLPLVSLIIKAGIVIERADDSVTRSWSALKCLRIVVESPARYHRELFDSLRIGLLAATIATALATVWAWWACRSRAGLVMLGLMVAVTAALPGPIVGLLIIEGMNRPELPPLIWLYDRTITAPCLAQVVRTLPLAAIVAWQALRSVPQATVDSAASEGAPALATLLRVALPQRGPLLAAVWVGTLALALGELPATILVEPPGVTTLPVRIFGLLHAGNEDEVAGICLAVVLACVLLAVVIGRLLARGWKRDSEHETSG